MQGLQTHASPCNGRWITRNEEGSGSGPLVDSVPLGRSLVDCYSLIFVLSEATAWDVLSMSGPNAFRSILLAVDGPEDLERVERELGKRYGTDYRVACESPLTVRLVWKVGFT